MVCTVRKQLDGKVLPPPVAGLSQGFPFAGPSSGCSLRRSGPTKALSDIFVTKEFTVLFWFTQTWVGILVLPLVSCLVLISLNQSHETWQGHAKWRIYGAQASVEHRSLLSQRGWWSLEPTERLTVSAVPFLRVGLSSEPRGMKPLVYEAPRAL